MKRVSGIQGYLREKLTGGGASEGPKECVGASVRVGEGRVLVMSEVSTSGRFESRSVQYVGRWTRKQQKGWKVKGGASEEEEKFSC